MWRILGRIKAVIDWAGTIATVLGWLGLTALASGLLVSVGGAVWAGVRGISPPIIVMAGFCAFVAAIYFAMAPAAYRFISSAPNARAIRPDPPEPNYSVWTHVEIITLEKAARLWSEYDPNYMPYGHAAAKVNMWKTVLSDAVRRGELRVASSDETDQKYPNDDTETTRSALRAFAQRKGFAPRFLRDMPG